VAVLQVSVSSTAGYVSLLVVRAQGLVGDVSVEWRTADGTARSAGKLQPDFLVSQNVVLLLSRALYQYTTAPLSYSGVARNFRQLIIVSKLCADYLIRSLTTSMPAGLMRKSLRNRVPKYYVFS